MTDYFIHHCLANGVPLSWCPFFAYCADCHAGRNKSTSSQDGTSKYIKNHCRRCKCEPVDTTAVSRSKIIKTKVQTIDRQDVYCVLCECIDDLLS